MSLVTGREQPVVEPSDDEWLRAFGVVPTDEEVTGDDLVREVKIPIVDDGLLHLTSDVADGSVRVRWYIGDVRVVDVFRQSVSSIKIESPERGVTQVRAAFGDSRSTDLLVTVWPRFRMEDVPEGKRL
jgi:hypothetical protein